jgi:hypothetical protein
MKKISIALGISLILVMVVVSSGLAALPGTGWWSALWVQNTSGGSGQVSMIAYDNNSSSSYDSATFDFAPFKSLVYDPGKAPNYPSGNYIGFSSPLPSGFEGAVVLSANVPSASVAQLANFANGSVGGTGKASAMYQGVGADMLATRLLAPTIKHNYSRATTTMYIQAAGADANVTVTYTMADGSVYVQSESIGANRAFLFDPANVGIPSTNCGSSTMTSPCYGSAVVTSTAPIAGVLLEHPHSGTPVSFVQAMRLTTPQEESTKIYVPSVKNDFCGGSGCGVAGAAVQNVSSTTDATVRITLTVTKLGTNAPSSVRRGDVFTQTVTIPAGTNYNFSKWNNNLGGLPAGTMAAAVIESLNTVPLVGSSNDSKTQPGFPGEAKVKYSAFADELATPLAFAPMVKEFFGIFTGGATVQNVGDSADYINIEYHEFGSSKVCLLRTLELVPVGGAAETNFVSRTGASQFSISGNCTAFSDLPGSQYSIKAYTDSGQDIIIMVTENTPNGTLDISRYEGVNISD